MFLQAAEMSGMKAQFDLPGFTATILAPSDAAFTTFLNGTASQYVELVVPKRSSLLAQLLSLALGLALAPAPAHAPAARAWLYPCLRSCPCPFSFSFPSVALFLSFSFPSALFQTVHRGHQWHLACKHSSLAQHATCSLYEVCRVPCFTSNGATFTWLSAAVLYPALQCACTCHLVRSICCCRLCKLCIHLAIY